VIFDHPYNADYSRLRWAGRFGPKCVQNIQIWLAGGRVDSVYLMFKNTTARRDHHRAMALTPPVARPGYAEGAGGGVVAAEDALAVGGELFLCLHAEALADRAAGACGMRGIEERQMCSPACSRRDLLVSLGLGPFSGAQWQT
jgi:hypothetical protein